MFLLGKEPLQPLSIRAVDDIVLVLSLVMNSPNDIAKRYQLRHGRASISNSNRSSSPRCTLRAVGGLGMLWTAIPILQAWRHCRLGNRTALLVDLRTLRDMSRLAEDSKRLQSWWRHGQS